MTSYLTIKKTGNVEETTQCGQLLAEIDKYNKQEVERIARTKAEREKWLKRKNGK